MGYCSRGMILMLRTGSMAGKSVQTRPVAASWTAMRRRITSPYCRRLGPRRSRSRASSRSRWVTDSRASLPAIMEAVLTRLASWAPLKRCVSKASSRRSTSAAYGRLSRWTLRMSIRPLKSGRSTRMMRSKRPGRMSAGSSTSLRLVAAITITPESASKPSISLSIWLRVWSRSSLPCAPPRMRPTASISSMNTMAGARARA
mmetsp:Transcript_15492/g.43372  ORF Transcript_15492/g.43372 Transcript_15492/m.43372 type:complete len:202 (-) Transcript_15492:1132-1737(-)